MHIYIDYGEGFCVFSDIAVAANLALLEFPGKPEQSVLISSYCTAETQQRRELKLIFLEPLGFVFSKSAYEK